MAKYVERWSASLAVREMQIKTTVSFLPSRRNIIRKVMTSIGKDAEKLDPSYIALRI